jgi:hypothetical protein
MWLHYEPAVAFVQISGRLYTGCHILTAVDFRVLNPVATSNFDFHIHC